MFGIRKRIEKLEKECCCGKLLGMIRGLENLTSSQGKRIEDLEENLGAQQKEIEGLQKKVKELSKRTISQKTTEEEEPITFSKVMDEWLNGADGTEG